MKRTMQRRNAGKLIFSIILVTISANLKSHLKKSFFDHCKCKSSGNNHFFLFSLLCVLTSQTVLKLMIASWAELARSFTFSCCHTIFSCIISVLLFHIISAFAFTQGKSYIKVVVKSLLLKICSPPTQQISFFHFQFFSSVLLEAICEISVFSNTTCLLSILTFTKVIYAHKLAFCSLSREIFREIFLSGEIFYIQDPLLAVHRCQSVTTIEGIAFLFLLFSLPATSML